MSELDERLRDFYEGDDAPSEDAELSFEERVRLARYEVEQERLGKISEREASLSQGISPPYLKDCSLSLSWDSIR